MLLLRTCPDLDEGFLLVLNQSIEACREEDETVVGELLETTKQELMSALSQHFSPTIKALVDLAAIPTRADRLRALTSLLGPRMHAPRQSGGEAAQQPHREIPSLESVAYTTLQVIEDMENSAPVLNTQLLARLCVLVLDLEELAAAEALSTTKAGSRTRLALLGSFYPRVGEVPDTLMGFLKELLHVARQSKRASGKAPLAEDAGRSMRPLRFLQTLAIVSQELEQRLSRAEKDAASGDALEHAALAAQIAGRDGPSEPVQERLCDIERDVSAVLMRMAWPEQADWEDME
ncbi:hypothetical protein H632_c102p0 [Helicosporidium sp. ATCC 50920]|nr:hypothetical protein H632_c102p0 [Helicosporidium sp. ATCC 50920]|eukprot:KDD76793.1 hypothetical protein H632_c102p0 [Helicosporidium sp. ATCC 50920]